MSVEMSLSIRAWMDRCACAASRGAKTGAEPEEPEESRRRVEVPRVALARGSRFPLCKRGQKSRSIGVLSLLLLEIDGFHCFRWV